MKRVISAILMVLMLSASLVACDAEKSEQTVQVLPQSVDLRDFNGKNYVTPVKRQVFGDCWSFGIAGAAEISYLYANDMGVPAGQVNDAVDFSEKYNAWYVYHSITQGDVTEGKIRQSQVGEGYDTSKSESEFAEAVYTFGGASYSGANLFASGFLPVDESVCVNGEYPYAYKGKHSRIFEGEVQYAEGDDWTILLNSEYRNPESDVVFRDGFMLPCPAAFDENGEYIYNEDGVNAIKSELANGHGVAFALLCIGSMNYENWAAYNRSGMSNHVVTVVGYDDNYPKENFALKYTSGEVKEDSIPPADGAFILKNSYGEWGAESSGYFYLSYYDQTISSPFSFCFDKSDSAKYQKPDYDQYDMLMIGWYGHNDYDTETKIANVFDAQKDEYLFEIAYKTPMPDTSVHYEIYKNVSDGEPDSGELLFEGDSAHQWAGYHNIDLDDEYELKKGEKYSIVLTMMYKAQDGSTRYTDIVSYACSLEDNATANGVVNKGESYLFIDGKWCDESDIIDTLKQQMYDQNVLENIPDAFKAHSVEDIAIDNYPIKGILIPKIEHK